MLRSEYTVPKTSLASSSALNGARCGAVVGVPLLRIVESEVGRDAFPLEEMGRGSQTRL